MVLWKSHTATGAETVEVRLPSSGRLYAMTSNEPRFVETYDLAALTTALHARFPSGTVTTPAALQ